MNVKNLVIDCKVSVDLKFNPNNIDVRVYILCYNEELLIPTTVAHYRKMFPNCVITICDNESTDRSVEIARSLGCEIYSFASNNLMCNEAMTTVRNHIWKTYCDGWVIVCDMDELLLITYEDLVEEETLQNTMLDIEGYQMVARSQTTDLSDINLLDVNNGFADHIFNKKLCFKRTCIWNTHYSGGCHFSFPCGFIRFSYKKYRLYHYNYLGEEYTYDKYQNRFDRSVHQHHLNLSVHYTKDREAIHQRYLKYNSQVVQLQTLKEFYEELDRKRTDS